MNDPLFYLSAFSVLLSLLLFFYNKGYNRANLFLSGYFFCSSLFLLAQYFFLNSKSIVTIAFFTTICSSLFYLIGPFAYFYVRSMFRDNIKFSKKDYLHFVFFFIVFIGILPFLFSSKEYKSLVINEILNQSYLNSNYNINFFITKRINQFLKPFFALYYSVLITKLFIKNKIVFSSFSNSKTIKVWLILFYLLNNLSFIFYFVAQLGIYFENRFLLDTLWSYIVNTIAFIYLVFNMSLFLFPNILYGLPIAKTAASRQRNDLFDPSIENSLESKKRIKNSKMKSNENIFNTEYILEIESVINNWVAEKKFLEQNAKLLLLSNYTNVPMHHLTYFFNEILKVKYTDWRNKLRIEYAKSQLDNGLYKIITLEALSAECGFASQSTFIKSFKNIFGCTPSDFIKKQSSLILSLVFLF